MCLQCGLTQHDRCRGWSSCSLASESEFCGYLLAREVPRGSDRLLCDLGPVQHLLAAAEGETCILRGQQ